MKSLDDLQVTHHKFVGAASPFKEITASLTLKEEQSGYIFGIGTDALTVTLPSVATMKTGVTYTFVNIGADGNNIITLSPASVDGINGAVPASSTVATTPTAGGVPSVASGGDGKDWENTKTTALTGDRCTLVSDGETGWFITSGIGTWASES